MEKAGGGTLGTAAPGHVTHTNINSVDNVESLATTPAVSDPHVNTSSKSETCHAWSENDNNVANELLDSVDAPFELAENGDTFCPTSPVKQIEFDSGIDKGSETVHEGSSVVSTNVTVTNEHGVFFVPDQAGGQDCTSVSGPASGINRIRSVRASGTDESDCDEFYDAVTTPSPLDKLASFELGKQVCEDLLSTKSEVGGMVETPECGDGPGGKEALSNKDCLEAVIESDRSTEVIGNQEQDMSITGAGTLEASASLGSNTYSSEELKGDIDVQSEGKASYLFNNLTEPEAQLEVGICEREESDETIVSVEERDMPYNEETVLETRTNLAIDEEIKSSGTEVLRGEAERDTELKSKREFEPDDETISSGVVGKKDFNETFNEGREAKSGDETVSCVELEHIESDVEVKDTMDLKEELYAGELDNDGFTRLNENQGVSTRGPECQLDEIASSEEILKDLEELVSSKERSERENDQTLNEKVDLRGGERCMLSQEIKYDEHTSMINEDEQKQKADCHSQDNEPGSNLKEEEESLFSQELQEDLSDFMVKEKEELVSSEELREDESAFMVTILPHQKEGGEYLTSQERNDICTTLTLSGKEEGGAGFSSKNEESSFGLCKSSDLNEVPSNQISDSISKVVSLAEDLHDQSRNETGEPAIEDLREFVNETKPNELESKVEAEVNTTVEEHSVGFDSNTETSPHRDKETLEAAISEIQVYSEDEKSTPSAPKCQVPDEYGRTSDSFVTETAFVRNEQSETHPYENDDRGLVSSVMKDSGLLSSTELDGQHRKSTDDLSDLTNAEGGTSCEIMRESKPERIGNTSSVSESVSEGEVYDFDDIDEGLDLDESFQTDQAVGNISSGTDIAPSEAKDDLEVAAENLLQDTKKVKKSSKTKSKEKVKKMSSDESKRYSLFKGKKSSPDRDTGSIKTGTKKSKSKLDKKKGGSLMGSSLSVDTLTEATSGDDKAMSSKASSYSSLEPDDLEGVLEKRMTGKSFKKSKKSSFFKKVFK